DSFRRVTEEQIQIIQHGLEDFLALNWFRDEAIRSQICCPFAYVFRGDYTNGNVTTRNVILQPLQDAPSLHVRQENIKRDRGGLEIPDKCKRCAAQRRNKALTSRRSGGVEQKAGEPQIVFYDQKHFIPGTDECPVVADLIDQLRRFGAGT